MATILLWIIYGWVAAMILVAFYVAAMNYKIVKKRGFFDEGFSKMGNFKRLFYITGWFVGIVGILLDILWNLTVGTYVFRQRPDHLFEYFTDRLNRNKLGPAGWRRDKADEFCEVLDQYEPGGHCKSRQMNL